MNILTSKLLLHLTKVILILGICAGMSVMSMVEVIVFFYIILQGIFQDIRQLKHILISYFGYINHENGQKSSIERLEKGVNTTQIHICDETNDFDEHRQEIQKLYVSGIFQYKFILGVRF